MPELGPIPVAGLTGFVSGLLLCIPVGPVNLTIINEGARRGFLWALLIGLGASTMEVIYCTIAFTGSAELFDNRIIRASMEVFSFVFMLFLGFKFLMARAVVPVPNNPLSAAAGKIEQRIEQKIHPHSAFATGFVRTMANPGVLLYWIILAANLISHEWVEPTRASKVACITGVALGTSLWFTCLSRAVSLGHGRFSEKNLLRLEHYSGLALLIFGIVQGMHIAWQLVHHKL